MNIANKKFYLIYFSIAITLISIITLVIKTSTLKNNDFFSQNYFQETFLQNEREFTNLIYIYTTSLKSLRENPYLYSYIVHNEYEKFSQELFLHNKKSLPLFFQIRYLDKNGNEKIRIDGDTIKLYKNEAQSRITPKSELQNKSNRDYFKRFIKLAPGELGYSLIDLNKDHGVITVPKEPTLRIGMAFYGNHQQPQGVLIYNVSLRHFFIHLAQSSRYNFMMIDKQGNFLVHYDEKYGVLGNDSNYTLKDEFPHEYRNILDNDKYETPSLFSSRISHFDNTQDIKMILTLRSNTAYSINRWILDNIILFLVLFVFIMLPVVKYFTRKIK